MNQQSQLKHCENEYFMDSNKTDWWLADNVCELLEIKDMESVISSLGADEKDEASFQIGSTEQEKVIVVNLKGFLSLILRSEAPVADKFRSWMASGIIFKLLLSDGLIDTFDISLTEGSEEVGKLHNLTIDKGNLKPKPGVDINPPLEDGDCECCGKSISELKPFGGPGDPLAGDFTGEYLVKTYRPNLPINADFEIAYEEAERCYKNEGFESPYDWITHKHDKKVAEKISEYFQGQGDWSSSECRDCILLDDNEYHLKMSQNWP